MGLITPKVNANDNRQRCANMCSMASQLRRNRQVHLENKRLLARNDNRNRSLAKEEIEASLRSRPDGRDVSVRNVMGHLEGQATVFRSDVNDWVRPRNDDVQPTFGGAPDSNPQNTSTQHRLSLKTVTRQ